MLQITENAMDPIHAVFLHARVSGAQFAETWGQMGVVDFHERDDVASVAVAGVVSLISFSSSGASRSFVRESPAVCGECLRIAPRSPRPARASRGRPTWHDRGVRAPTGLRAAAS